MTVLSLISKEDAREVVEKINGPSAALRRGKGKWSRRNKFNAVRTIVGGVAFHSKREAKDWQYLKIRENAGEISELKRQVKFELFACAADGSRIEKAFTYVADFTWKDLAGAFHVGDSKGCITPDFRLKKKMMLICYGIEVELM